MTAPTEPAGDKPTGYGEGANGKIRATVGSDGHLQNLHLDPQLMQMGQRGPVMDSQTIAEAITTAVNGALDDLYAKARGSAGDVAGQLEADLDQVTGNFERALDQIQTDIARAQRRLES